MQKQTGKAKIVKSVKAAKKAGQLGRHGITGTTGLGVAGFFHISAPYDSNGMHFVRYLHKKWGESWKRVKKSRAKPEQIIRCHYCNLPAVRLDHLWPYYDDATSCGKHLNSWHKSERKSKQT